MRESSENFRSTYVNTQKIWIPLPNMGVRVCIYQCLGTHKEPGKFYPQIFAISPYRIGIFNFAIPPIPPIGEDRS